MRVFILFAARRVRRQARPHRLRGYRRGACVWCPTSSWMPPSRARDSHGDPRLLAQPAVGPTTGTALYAADVTIHAKEMFNSETGRWLIPA